MSGGNLLSRNGESGGTGLSEEQIRLYVLGCIDEVLPGDAVNLGLNYPIGQFMNEAAVQLLLTAPLHLVPLEDFSDAVPDVYPDGHGRVELPEGFLRLAEFRMRGWRRSVFSPYGRSDSSYARQSNPYTRGDEFCPAVVLDERYLYYYALPEHTEHAIEGALAVARIPVGEEYPRRLVAPMAWLAACKALAVMNEAEAAAVAMGEYERLLAALA